MILRIFCFAVALSLAHAADAANLSAALSLLSPDTNINLTTTGTLDWGHWGYFTENTYIHKYGVASQIDFDTIVESIWDGPYWQRAAPSAFTWSDGVPVEAASNTVRGVFFIGAAHGFQIICPADTVSRTLRLYVGADGVSARLSATLSDGSAPAVTNTAYANPGAGSNAVFTLKFQAASSGQTLTIRCVIDQDLVGGGSLILQAVALASANVPPKPSITSPSSGTVFVAPASFTIAAVATNGSGTVTNLSIRRGNTMMGRTNGDSLTMSMTTQATNVLTFTAVAIDNAGLSVTSAPVKVYVTTGGGVLNASIDSPPPRLDLTQEGKLDWTHWGLTSSSNYDHKASVPQQIPDVVPLISGLEMVNQYSDNFTAFSWTDGTPTPAATDSTTGIFVYGAGKGFQLTVPATNTVRRLKVYLGLYGAWGKFEAALSDGSGPWYSDTSLANPYNNAYGVYTIDFASPSPSANLVVRWTSIESFDRSYGNVTWQAATLASIITPPTLEVLRPLSPDEFVFSFPTQPGFNYTVLSCDSLELQNWQAVTNLIGQGETAWITNSPPPPSTRFYRLQAQ